MRWLSHLLRHSNSLTSYISIPLFGMINIHPSGIKKTQKIFLFSFYYPLSNLRAVRKNVNMSGFYPILLYQRPTNGEYSKKLKQFILAKGKFLIYAKEINLKNHSVLKNHATLSAEKIVLKKRVMARCQLIK